MFTETKTNGWRSRQAAVLKVREDSLYERLNVGVSVCVRTCSVQYQLFSLAVSKRNRLVGLVVKASTSKTADPGFESRLRLDFPGRVIPVT